MTILGSNPRATVNPAHPDAFGICDRCGFLWNRKALRYQYQWRGTALVDTRVLVCPDCMDIPNEQLRTIVIPPDPVPVIDARPPAWASENGATPNVSVVELLAPED